MPEAPYVLLTCGMSPDDESNVASDLRRVGAKSIGQELGIRDRGRTCIVLLRRQAPYPLGHSDTRDGDPAGKSNPDLRVDNPESLPLEHRAKSGYGRCRPAVP